MDIRPERIDARVRLAAFDWLAKQVKIYGDVLPCEVLARGFQFDGVRVPLVSPQGIFKPKVLSGIPLTIATTTKGPYKDSFGNDGLLQYSYRGTDPGHSDNLGLRKAMAKQVPLIYFHSVVPGKYLAVWPVYIVGDSPKSLKFTVAADDMAFVQQHSSPVVSDVSVESEARRVYITRSVKQRLHQRGFRERVLRAYREQCAFCKLRHLELLDAAHIVADSDPEGEPSVTNGLSLCKLHHAAFDSNIVGIRPDYIIEVRKDVLDEEDGPMLKHGLVALNRKPLILPSPVKLSPDKLLLERRYEEFRAAG